MTKQEQFREWLLVRQTAPGANQGMTNLKRLCAEEIAAKAAEIFGQGQGVDELADEILSKMLCWCVIPGTQAKAEIKEVLSRALKR